MIVMMDIQLVNICSNSCWFCPPYSKDCKDKVEYINIDKLVEFISYGISNKHVANNTQLSINRYCDPLLSLDSNIEFIKKIKAQHKEVILHSIIPTNNLLKVDSVKVKEFFNELNDLKVNIYKHMSEPKDFDSHTRKVINYMLSVYNTKKFKIERDSSALGNVIIIDNNGKNRANIFIDQEANLKNSKMLKSRGGSISSLVDTSFLRETVCEPSKLHFGIDSNGDIMPCCDMYSRTESHKPYIVGNIYTDSFEDIYQTILTRDYLDEEPCKHCVFEGRWLRR